MRIKRFPIVAGAVIELPHAFMVRATAIEHGQLVAYIELDTLAPVYQRAVLALGDDAAIPQLALYLATIPALPPVHVRTWRPSWPVRPSAQHFYLVEVRHAG